MSKENKKFINKMLSFYSEVDKHKHCKIKKANTNVDYSKETKQALLKVEANIIKAYRDARIEKIRNHNKNSEFEFDKIIMHKDDVIEILNEQHKELNK